MSEAASGPNWSPEERRDKLAQMQKILADKYPEAAEVINGFDLDEEDAGLNLLIAAAMLEGSVTLLDTKEAPVAEFSTTNTEGGIELQARVPTADGVTMSVQSADAVAQVIEPIGSDFDAGIRAITGE
ncbi:MAG TPA: hypothetical protein VLH86_01875 [Patescibacteria group bacterium]|nr:hypothetical protein [Patescibacteria group bacterium]